jgi:hypothetical protein
MEILVIALVAIVGLILGFVRGQQSERSKARRKELDGIDDQITDVGGQIEEIEDEIRDSQARDLTPEEAIRILRTRHGWGPTDDHAP